MRDFVLTHEFAARYNHLANVVESCLFADNKTNASLMEQAYMLHGDLVSQMALKTMGDWELYQFEEETAKLENMVEALRGELVEICPSLGDMPQYYDVWERILGGMFSPGEAWWEEHMSESFWAQRGVSDSCKQVACTFAVIGLQSLYGKVQKMMSDVKRKYAIEAAGGTITDEAVQLANDGEKEREAAKNDAVLLTCFKGDKARLAEYVEYCLKVQTTAERARYARKLKDRKVIDCQLKTIWERLREIGIESAGYSTWKSGYN